VGVDHNNVNKAWAKEMGITYPLLSDIRREMLRAYDALYDDPKLAEDPGTITRYLRAKRAFFVIDKEGTVRYAKITEPRDATPPTDEILKVLNELK
jgi:peroxiredoxin